MHNTKTMRALLYALLVHGAEGSHDEISFGENDAVLDGTTGAGRAPDATGKFTFFEMNLLQMSASTIVFPWLFTFDYKSLNLTEAQFRAIHAGVKRSFETQWNSESIVPIKCGADLEAAQIKMRNFKATRDIGIWTEAEQSVVKQYLEGFGETPSFPAFAFNCWKSIPVDLVDSADCFKAAENVSDVQSISVEGKDYVHSLLFHAAGKSYPFTSLLGVAYEALLSTVQDTSRAQELALAVVKSVRFSARHYNYRTRGPKLMRLIAGSGLDVGVVPELQPGQMVKDLVEALPEHSVIHVPRACGGNSGLGVIYKNSVWEKLWQKDNLLSNDCDAATAVFKLRNTQLGFTLNVVAAYLATASKDADGRLRATELKGITDQMQELTQLGEYTIFSGDFNTDLLGDRRPQESIFQGTVNASTAGLTGYSPEDGEKAASSALERASSELEGAALSHLACPGTEHTGACFTWCLHEERNAPEGSSEKVPCTNRHLLDVFKEEKSDQDGGCTSKTDAREERIDFVWGSENLRVRELTTQGCPLKPIPDGTHPSDHVWLKVVFEPQT